MCRMLALRSNDAREVAAVLSAFRRQARHGATGTPEVQRHPDGWGVVAGDEQGVAYWGRSVGDAFADPAFDAVVGRAKKEAASLVVAHLRNASVGALKEANTHPFIAEGWAFAHNGTIHDAERIAVPGAVHAGDTDSERYFRRFLHELRKARDPRTALQATVGAIDASCSYSSLTCMFTDGRTLYAYRRLGPDPAECGTRECQAGHYTLGYGRRGDAVVLAQEPTHLGLETWTEIPDGQLVVWPRGQPLAAAPLMTLARRVRS